MPDSDHESKVRLRRTKSVTRAEEIQRMDYMLRKSQPDKPSVFIFFFFTFYTYIYIYVHIYLILMIFIPRFFKFLNSTQLTLIYFINFFFLQLISSIIT